MPIGSPVLEIFFSELLDFAQKPQTFTRHSKAHVSNYLTTNLDENGPAVAVLLYCPTVKRVFEWQCVHEGRVVEISVLLYSPKLVLHGRD
ncbi:hypothetical protein Trydic_g1669 [Trypoxylus dichotomus]